MTSSNELGMPIWLSTSRFAPPTDIFRTKQSIPEPSNEIVPAFMTFWRWVPRFSSIRTPLCQSVQKSPKQATRVFACGNDHGYPIRPRSAFHKTTTASPLANTTSTLVGKVSLSHLMDALVRFSQPDRYDRFQAHKSIALQQSRSERRIPCDGKPRR